MKMTQMINLKNQKHSYISNKKENILNKIFKKQKNIIYIKLKNNENYKEGTS